MTVSEYNDPSMVHLPCPECDSSDAYSINSKGWGHCYSCGVSVPPADSGIALGESASIPSEKSPTPFHPIATRARPFRSRGLSAETIRTYKVDVGSDLDNYEARYPLFDLENNHIGNKVRRRGKLFTYEGSAKAGLFGRHAFPPGGKYITITEGQDDAMAVHEMFGRQYPCVSVHSSSTAEKDCRNDFEYLNSFETIVLAFDNDEPGQKAARAVANLGFPLGKVRILTLKRHKDANDYLLHGDTKKFIEQWWQAPVHKPDGLKMGSQMWDEIINRKEHFTVRYPFTGLNTLTYGLRFSEMVVLTADTGVGKTAVIKTIEHELLTNPEVKENDYGVGFLHLEEPNGDTALGLLSIHNSVPYHLPDVERPEADLRRAYDELLNNERVVIWDHFGSNSVDAVLDKIRHMVALGCRYIVLDHLSIIVSDQSGDERKQLDEIATKLKTLTMELDIAVIAVIHTNRQGQIRGTAGVEQLANIVLRLERNKTDDNEWRRNVTKVSVEKNRFCGYTGPACYLWYNKETGTLTELEAEAVQTYENGGTMSDTDIPF